MVTIETYVEDEDLGFTVDWALKIRGLRKGITYYGRWYDSGELLFFNFNEKTRKLNVTSIIEMSEILGIELPFKINRRDFKEIVRKIKMKWEPEDLFE